MNLSSVRNSKAIAASVFVAGVVSLCFKFGIIHWKGTTINDIKTISPVTDARLIDRIDNPNPPELHITTYPFVDNMSSSDIYNKILSVNPDDAIVEPVVLSGTSISKHGRIAIINHKVVVNGDFISGYRVVTIHAGRVTLLDQKNKKIILKISRKAGE